MKINALKKDSFVLLEILADNGSLSSASNPILATEYASVDYPNVNGRLAVVSGMPMSAAAMVAIKYKNLFVAIAIANPLSGVAEIVHSASKEYSVGTSIPLT